MQFNKRQFNKGAVDRVEIQTSGYDDMADIIIKNAYVLTMDPDAGDIKKGTVVIEDGKITEIGVKTKESADTVIDAKGSVVMPGLVNTHTHAAMTLFRGYADDLQLCRMSSRSISGLQKPSLRQKMFTEEACSRALK